jgi:hypothetical protein
MSIRQDLQADFGIDVKIDGGEGTRSDPFQLEPCTADDGALTQLALLRTWLRPTRVVALAGR